MAAREKDRGNLRNRVVNRLRHFGGVREVVVISLSSFYELPQPLAIAFEARVAAGGDDNGHGLAGAFDGHFISAVVDTLQELAQPAAGIEGGNGSFHGY